MSILEYSVAKKIYNDLLGIASAPDEVKMISKKVTVAYTDLSGTSISFDIGKIPEGCSLMHSQVNISTPFLTSSLVPCKLNSGIGDHEGDSSVNYSNLIFSRCSLGTEEAIVYQGVMSDLNADKTLNKFQNKLELTFFISGIWSAGGNLETARYGLAGCGTQSAGLSFGGYDTGYKVKTEEYNGTSWLGSGALNTARSHLAGCGIQDAGLSFGGTTGSNSAVTEEYNGTSWTASGSLNIARYGIAGCGTQNAGLSFGGSTGTVQGTTEEYNGSSWSIANTLSIFRHGLSGCGTQTVGLSFGGYTSTRVANAEEYDGTSWTTANSMIIARNMLSGFGNQSSAISAGGYITAVANETEEYNGDVWLTGNGLNGPRSHVAGCGTKEAGMIFGGDGSGGPTASTEELNVADLTSLTQGALSFYITYTYV